MRPDRRYISHDGASRDRVLGGNRVLEGRAMLTPATLTSRMVQLEPLVADHAEALAAAAAEDRHSYAYT